MIEVERLKKDYGTIVAVHDLSFSVARGEVVGFLGPNGAGKSTTLRILTGYLGATAGRVQVCGHDVMARPLLARRAIGYLPEGSPLYPELKVREYLTFRARLKGVPRKTRSHAIERAMDLSGVAGLEDTLIQHLSRGYRQRVGLADALVASPPLLVLDEPTAGLDPNQIRQVRRVIRELAPDHTVLLSTHILSEAESTCDRALVIDQGRLVASGTIEQLRALRQGQGAALVLSDPQGCALSLLRSMAQIEVLESEPLAGEAALWRVRVGFPRGSAALLEQVVSSLVLAGVGVREASPARASLEEVFAQLTGAQVEPNEALDREHDR